MRLGRGRRSSGTGSPATPAANYGFQVDTVGIGPTYWKRLIASEQGTATRPRLTVTYHAPVTPALPGGGVLTSSSTVWWTDEGSWATDGLPGPGRDERHVRPEPRRLRHGHLDGELVGDPVGADPRDHLLLAGQGQERARNLVAVLGAGVVRGRQRRHPRPPGLGTFETFDLGRRRRARGQRRDRQPRHQPPDRVAADPGGQPGPRPRLQQPGHGQRRLRPGLAPQRPAPPGLNADGTVTFTDADGARHTFTNPQRRQRHDLHPPATLYATLVRNTNADARPLHPHLPRPVGRRVRHRGLETGAPHPGRGPLRQRGHPRLRRRHSRISTIADPGRAARSPSPATARTGSTSITDWAYVVAAGVVQASATGSLRSHRFFYDGANGSPDRLVRSAQHVRLLPDEPRAT